jgi:hypothetical protein
LPVPGRPPLDSSHHDLFSQKRPVVMPREQVRIATLPRRKMSKKRALRIAL